MVRYCGQCGAGLDAAAFSVGRCPICGTEIADMPAVPSHDEAEPSENYTRAAYVPMDATTLQSEVPGKPPRTRRRAPAVWMVCLVAAAVLLLSGTAVLAVTHFSTGTLSASSDLAHGRVPSTVTGAATVTAKAA